jgi:hypothetical protein
VSTVDPAEVARVLGEAEAAVRPDPRVSVVAGLRLAVFGAPDAEVPADGQPGVALYYAALDAVAASTGCPAYALGQLPWQRACGALRSQASAFRAKAGGSR